MLIFIDESGHPHPNDAHRRPVVVAVCIEAENSRLISGRIHSLKRDILKRERLELKGRNLLNRGTYQRKPEFAAFAEEFFRTITELPLTIFAVIMEAPFFKADEDDNFLPNRFRFLVQRIQLLAESKQKMATIMFDGTPDLYKDVGWKFNSFLYRSEEGRAYNRITDAPAFVDSVTSAGIQIADMVAYVIRKYQEEELFRTMPPTGDLYLFAIRRWYSLIERSVIDQQTEDGERRPGMYLMIPGDV